MPQKDLKGYEGLPQLQANTKLNGVLSVDYAFTLKLSSLSSDGKATGTISWPSASALTSFEGSVKDSDFSFDETKSMLLFVIDLGCFGVGSYFFYFLVLKGDGIDIPVKYIGKLDEVNKTLTGTYEASTSKGVFTLTETRK